MPLLRVDVPESVRSSVFTESDVQNYKHGKYVDIPAAGHISVARSWYAPLEEVVLQVTLPAQSAIRHWLLVIEDARGKVYFQSVLDDSAPSCSVRLRTAGSAGVHTVRLKDPDASLHQCVAHFELRLATQISTGDARLDRLIETTRDRMRLNRRMLNIQGTETAGYITSDSWNYASIWLRDMSYQLRAYRYWEPDLKSCVEPFFTTQLPSGKLFDNYNASGKLHRMESESDLEYLLVLAAYWTWQATGDDQWIKEHWPALEKALAFPRNETERWMQDPGLPLRGHTCDTWDFNINGTDELYPRVAALCDLTGFHLAHRIMADWAQVFQMPERLRWHSGEAVRLASVAEKHFWDGKKFLHHLHADPLDHGAFDESSQLAMSNTWAITRGLAKANEASRIIQTYFERAIETNQRPWWSLQPGYPKELGYFGIHGSDGVTQPGGYANGGLMPWVGGELCHACFLTGKFAEGWGLLDDYLDFFEENNGAIYTWYWPDMRPGYRTPNTTSHCGWGMAEWVCAVIEGLAGVRDLTSQFQKVRLQPAWFEVGFDCVRVVVRYGPVDEYVAYRAEKQPDGSVQIEVYSSGSGIEWVSAEGDTLFSVRDGSLQASETFTIESPVPGHWVRCSILSPG